MGKEKNNSPERKSTTDGIKKIPLPMILALVPVIGISAALIAEYGLHTYYTNSKLIYTLAIGTFIAGAAAWANPRLGRIAFPGAVFAGLLLAPYIAFAIGQIDIYMVDDDLAKGMSVKEVRVTMDDLIMVTDTGKELIVLAGGDSMVLHPGENEVRLGAMQIPKGCYESARIAPKRIEVDIRADLNEMAREALAKMNQKQKPSLDEIKNEIAQAFESGEAEKRAPEGFSIRFINTRRNGDILEATLDVKNAGEAMPGRIPLGFCYPGIGGPDITLDIILGQDGRPENIQPIVHLPPGAPIEQIQAMAGSIAVMPPAKPPIFTSS